MRRRPLKLVSQEHAHVTGDPLLIFGDDWGRHPSTLQFLAAQLGSSRPVVWVNSLGHRSPRVSLYDARRVITRLASAFTAAPSGIAATGLGPSTPHAILRPVFLPWHGSAIARRFNRGTIPRAIAGAFRGLGLNPASTNIVASTPVAAYYVDDIPHRKLCYLCLDEYAAMSGADAGMVREAEARMLARADVVVTTTAAFLSTRTKLPASGTLFHLPQGVDAGRFLSDGDRHPGIAALPGPRIGYAGTLDERIDLDLITSLSNAFSGGSIVLVGPLKADLSRLGQLANRNVHVLPPVAHAEIPRVYRAFDVGIIPFVRNDWTLAIEPLKALEYLATGIPTVATDLPELSRHAPHVRCVDAGGFINAVILALDCDTLSARHARQHHASQNSWAVRAAEFERMYA